MKTCIWGSLICVVLIGQISAQSNLAINGNIQGLQEKSAILLVEIYLPADTAAKGFAEGGKFALRAHIIEPGLYELDFVSSQKKIPLFLGGDSVAISGDINDLQNLKVVGSESNDEFMEFQKVFNSQILHLNSLFQTINSSHNITKDDTLVKEYTAVVTQIQMSQDRFLQKYKSSNVSAFMLFAFYKLSEDVFLAERRLNSLAIDVQRSFFGKTLKQQIANDKVGAIGSDELDFTQNDTIGKPVTLSSFKGKYVLVDFWASWCHPCRLENPNVVAIFNKFRKKNFTIVSVSLDRSRDPWLQAIKEDNLSWTHVSDLKFWNNDVAVKYHVQSIPQNFLIDPSGKIVAKNLRGPDLESKLCEYLGCN